MPILDPHVDPAPKADLTALFQQLGLRPADARSIVESLRQANAAWRQERMRRVEEHGQRVREHLRRFKHPFPDFPSAHQQGRRRAVWCVELRRRFASISEASRFVRSKPGNISRSLSTGGLCGRYHWEVYDERKHRIRCKTP